MSFSHPPLAWKRRSDRAIVQITGPDRAKFLHNLTTNDVKRLAPGTGQESFVTTPQGKTLAYVTVLADQDRLLVRTEASSAPALLAHLNKYGVFDDVQIDDLSDTLYELHLSGPETRAWVTGQGLPDPGNKPLANQPGPGVVVISESLVDSDGLTLLGTSEALHHFTQILTEQEHQDLSGAIFEALRIRQGVPLSGLDVTPNNLPQEVGRDSRTISFVKGCYLGQETVARLDALGHVNKLLRRLSLENALELPSNGAIISFEGKEVGRITSAALLDHTNAVALGYVKVAQATEGTRLAVALPGGEYAEAVVQKVV